MVWQTSHPTAHKRIRRMSFGDITNDPHQITPYTFGPLRYNNGKSFKGQPAVK